jgi:hypothetical protein
MEKTDMQRGLSNVWRFVLSECVPVLGELPPGKVGVEVVLVVDAEMVALKESEQAGFMGGPAMVFVWKMFTPMGQIGPKIKEL